ncbi:MAG TPA: class I SAM-dependent methyltransferase [Saprospiraceae bacterium]|nr:class I SAM-dependent methyltransferase [Saprospiraceae bacterium]
MPNIYDDDFSKLEHEGWSRVSDQYESAWANLTTQFIDPLLDAVGIHPGMQVLDVACGPGYVSQGIHLRMALPTGLDFSAAMVDLATRLFPHIRFVEGDAQRLEFPDETFDRVVMNFGMAHLIKPQEAIAEAHRVLKRNGKYGFTAWAGPELSPVAKVMNESIMQFADQSIQVPDAPAHYLFSDEQLCRNVLIEHGFDASGIQFRRHFIEWNVPTADFYFETEMRAGVRTVAFLKPQTSETLAKIKAAVREKMQQFYTGESYRLKFCGCVIAAVKR